MSDSDCMKNTSRENMDKLLSEKLQLNEDLLAEQILNNVKCTPIGQLLKKIASMPEIRKEKVTGVRRKLTQGSYDINQRLDLVLDKVLEELIN